jgi:hypothetical protein
MRAYVGSDLRCASCGRPQQAVTLRSGDAWVTCWYARCQARLWAVRVPGAQPTAADVAETLGERLAASVLATYAPAPLVVLEVPPAVAIGLQQASRLGVVARLTQVLVGDVAVKPAHAPRDRAA